MKVNSYAGLYECPMIMSITEAVIANVRSIGLQVREVLKVYPNPADQFVKLEHMFSADEGYVFRVINSLGHEMLNIQLEENEDIYECDTSSIQQGMYYVFLYKDGLILEYKLLSVLH